MYCIFMRESIRAEDQEFELFSLYIAIAIRMSQLKLVGSTSVLFRCNGVHTSIHDYFGLHYVIYFGILYIEADCVPNKLCSLPNLSVVHQTRL